MYAQPVIASQNIQIPSSQPVRRLQRIIETNELGRADCASVESQVLSSVYGPIRRPGEYGGLYALPTHDRDGNPLPEHEQKIHLSRLFDLCRDNPATQYRLSFLGSTHTDSNKVKHWFKDGPANIALPAIYSPLKMAKVAVIAASSPWQMVSDFRESFLQLQKYIEQKILPGGDKVASLSYDPMDEISTNAAKYLPLQTTPYSSGIGADNFAPGHMAEKHRAARFYEILQECNFVIFYDSGNHHDEVFNQVRAFARTVFPAKYIRNIASDRYFQPQTKPSDQSASSFALEEIKRSLQALR